MNTPQEVPHNVVIRKAFLPLVAKEATAAEFEFLTASLSEETGLTRQQIAAARAWVKIHAQRAIQEWSEENPGATVEVDQLIKVASELSELTITERAGSEVITNFSQETGCNRDQIELLVQSYLGRLRNSAPNGSSNDRDPNPETSLASSALMHVSDLFNTWDGKAVLNNLKQGAPINLNSNAIRILSMAADIYETSFSWQFSASVRSSLLEMSLRPSFTLADITSVSDRDPRFWKSALRGLAAQGIIRAAGEEFQVAPLLRVGALIDCCRRSESKKFQDCLHEAIKCLVLESGT